MSQILVLDTVQRTRGTLTKQNRVSSTHTNGFVLEIQGGCCWCPRFVSLMLNYFIKEKTHEVPLTNPSRETLCALLI